MKNDQQMRLNYKQYNSKIETYLTRISDLENTIEIHQHIIISHMKSLKPEQSTSSTTDKSSKQFESLLQETIALSQTVKDSYKELKVNQGKSFLTEQIYNDVSQKCNEITHEYTEKLNEYTFSSETKSKVIQELTDYNIKLSGNLICGVQNKFLQIVPPRDDLLEIHEKVEWMKEKIQELARTCFIAGEYKEILSDFYKKISLAHQKVQILLKNPINRKPGNERIHFTNSTEIIDDSEESEESSDVEISEMNRTATISKQSSIVPKIDFTKINKNKSVMTQQAVPKINYESSHIIKDLKTLYKSLNDSINSESEELESLSKENFKLQQENVRLMNELQNIPSSKPKIPIRTKSTSGLCIINEEQEY